ncbi:MAG TPA: hypothetical protein VH539_07085 [Gemmatimonadaceae bacterium]|jgi:hypothetical protein
MRITIESTNMITQYNGARARLWKGVTEKGITCAVFVVGLAVHEAKDQSQFEAELETMPKPREVELREVLSYRQIR